MLDFYKYLPTSAEDERWGLSILNTGCTSIKKHSDYPNAHHPSHHNFNWSKGRALQEYQVIYITRGEGIFESELSGTKNISEGTIIFLFPEQRHRYKPSKETGWDEYWVGFNGNIIENLIEKKFFRPEDPILYIGFDETLLNLFLQIIHKTREEKAGYQALVSGAVLHILGHIYSVSQQEKFEGQDIAEVVNKAQLLFRSNLHENISPADIARQLQISYSRFRKIFKAYTGLAPGQYQIQLRINRAKELLPDPSRSIKEIAYELNFESNFYFSKLFKEKTGMTPLQYKNYMQAKYKKRAGK